MLQCFCRTLSILFRMKLRMKLCRHIADLAIHRPVLIVKLNQYNGFILRKLISEIFSILHLLTRRNEL